MASFRLRHLLVSAAAASLIFACGDDDDDQPGSEPNGGAPSSSEGGAGPGHAGSASGGDDGHAQGAAECGAIGSLCHDGDEGEGPIRDCHELGHKGNAASCKAEFTACISLCVAEEPAAGGAGAGGATTAPEPVSNPYCQALGELCHFLDDHGTPTGECHELGHEGREPACIEAFANCVPLCLDKRKLAPDPHGEGGASHSEGGASHSEGGGHAEGGAAASAGGSGG